MSWHSKAAGLQIEQVFTELARPFSLSPRFMTNKINVSKGLVWQSKHRTTKLEHGHENMTFFPFLLTLTSFVRFPFTRSHIHPHSSFVFVVTSAQGLHAPRVSHEPTVHVNYKLGALGFCPSPAGKYNGTKQWVKWKQTTTKKTHSTSTTAVVEFSTNDWKISNYKNSKVTSSSKTYILFTCNVAHARVYVCVSLCGVRADAHACVCRAYLQR